MVRYEQFGLGRDLDRRVRQRRRSPRSSAGCCPTRRTTTCARAVDYPAVLFTVFDGDTRVDPMHARKMCAALQHATSGDRPVLLRGERDVGHGARALSRSVALTADTLAFAARWTGLRRSADVAVDSVASTGVPDRRPLGGSTVPFAATLPVRRRRVDLLRFRSCVDDKQTGTFCDWVYDTDQQQVAGRVVGLAAGQAGAILVILLLAALVRFAGAPGDPADRGRRRRGHRARRARQGPRAASCSASPLLLRAAPAAGRDDVSVLRSVTTGVIASVAALMILDVVGLPIGPLLASAGIVGVAVGFGAQTLVKDFLSGIFLILEDQYGVGDLVDTGMGTVGTIEAVGLRVTRLRDGSGVVWYVRNGEILRVGNHSQGWSTAIVDVSVAYTEDIPRVQRADRRDRRRRWPRRTAGGTRSSSRRPWPASSR